MLNQESNTKPYKGAPDCEVTGNCTFDFKSKDGRIGPVGISERVPEAVARKRIRPGLTGVKPIDVRLNHLTRRRLPPADR